MENLLIADPALNHAAPAPAAGSAAPELSQSPGKLRAALADAIEVRRAADIRAAEACVIAARADTLLRAARDEAARLDAGQRAEERSTTERRASAISAALRAGEQLPASSIPPMADPAPLTRAMVTLRAVEAAAADLFAECDAARGEAAVAAESCRILVNQIISDEGRAMAAEWIATVQTSWMLQDRLTGLARIGDGALLPRAFQTEVLNKIERRRVAMSGNATLIERPNFNAFLDQLSSAEEKRWLAYGLRLMESADAVFDVEALPQ